VLKPAAQQFVGARAGFEALAAAMLQLQRGLEQEDAALRVGRDDATALGALDDLGVVKSRIEAKQAETETASTLRRSVAGALIATGPRQEGHHLAREPYCRSGRRPLNAPRPLDRLAAGAHGSYRLAIAHGSKDALAVHGRHLRIAAGERRFAAQVAH